MRSLAVVVALLAVSAVGQASASTVSFDATLDLHTPGIFSPSGVLSLGGAGFSGLTPAQVGVGDFLHITYTFGGEAIAASDVTTAGPLVSQSSLAEDVNQTGMVSFLDVHGNALLTSALFSDGETGGSVGQIIPVSTGILTFYGLRYDGMLEAATPLTPRTFDTAELQLFGSGFAIVPVTATPIPGTLALFISALGSLGFVTWRR